MKSLDELKALRDIARKNIGMRREDPDAVRVVVGLGTCGISAGARAVLSAFADGVAENGLTRVMVTQSGCMGACELEPMVTVEVPGQDKVTYVNMTVDKVNEVIEKHLIGGEVVTEYLK